MKWIDSVDDLGSLFFTVDKIVRELKCDRTSVEVIAQNIDVIPILLKNWIQWCNKQDCGLTRSEIL